MCLGGFKQHMFFVCLFERSFGFVCEVFVSFWSDAEGNTGSPKQTETPKGSWWFPDFEVLGFSGRFPFHPLKVKLLGRDLRTAPCYHHDEIWFERKPQSHPNQVAIDHKRRNVSQDNCWSSRTRINRKSFTSPRVVQDSSTRVGLRGSLNHIQLRFNFALRGNLCCPRGCG